MTHSLPVLIAFAFAGLLTACDNAEPAKVPLKAGRGLAPAHIVSPAPTTESAADLVAAWVNEEPIGVRELETELGRLRTATRAIPPQRRTQVLARMIDERLLSQWSAKQPVVEAAIDAELHRVESEVFGSRDALLRHLDERDLTLEQYRAELRVELASAEKLASSEPPSDEEVEAMYREVTNRPPKRTLVRLSSVLLDPTADLRALDAEISSADEQSFAKLPGRQIALGWVDRSAIGDPLARAVFAVEPPGRTRALQTPAGTEVYWVHERAEETTPHFRELAPLLRRRAQEMQLSHARAELVRQLREKADIRIASVAQTGQPKAELTGR